jgi:erythromycin esterase-like protein
MSMVVTEEMSARSIRDYGFDVYSARKRAQDYVEWLNALPPEEAKKAAFKNLLDAGLIDENGELTECYR